MRLLSLILFSSSFSAISQPDSLQLADTLLVNPMEHVLFDDVDLFYQSFDTVYNDSGITLYQYNDSWAAKTLLHKNSDPEGFGAVLLDPDVNESVDSVEYIDMNADGIPDAIFYVSRTDGRSGQSGGFSDQGSRVIAIDVQNLTILFDFEYYAHYEYWDQEYDEEKDEYLSLGTECHGYSGSLNICEGKFLFVQDERRCRGPNDVTTRVICFYYTWNGDAMSRKSYSLYDGAICD